MSTIQIATMHTSKVRYRKIIHTHPRSKYYTPEPTNYYFACPNKRRKLLSHIFLIIGSGTLLIAERSLLPTDNLLRDATPPQEHRNSQYVVCYFVVESDGVVECGWRSILDRPCMVFHRMCALCLWSQCAARCSFHIFCLCFVCRKLSPHLVV